MENNIISIQNAEHYKWGASCEGWHLLKLDGLSVIEECMPPASSELNHYHNRAQQLFYILKGEAIFEMGGKECIILPGESIHVPAGTMHRISNMRNESLRFLVISSPKAHGDRVNIE